MNIPTVYVVDIGYHWSSSYTLSYTLYKLMSLLADFRNHGLEGKLYFLSLTCHFTCLTLYVFFCLYLLWFPSLTSPLHGRSFCVSFKLYSFPLQHYLIYVWIETCINIFYFTIEDAPSSFSSASLLLVCSKYLLLLYVITIMTVHVLLF